MSGRTSPSSPSSNHSGFDPMELVQYFHQHGESLPPNFLERQDLYTPTTPPPRIYTQPAPLYDLDYPAEEYVVIPLRGRVPIPTPPYSFQLHQGLVSPHYSPLSTPPPFDMDLLPSTEDSRPSPPCSIISVNSSPRSSPDVNAPPIIDLTASPTPSIVSIHSSPPRSPPVYPFLDFLLMEALHRIPSIEHPPPTLPREQLRRRRRFEPYPSAPSSSDRPGTSFH